VGAKTRSYNCWRDSLGRRDALLFPAPPRVWTEQDEKNRVLQIEESKQRDKMESIILSACGPSPSNNYPNDSDVPVFHMMYEEEHKARYDYQQCSAQAIKDQENTEQNIPSKGGTKAQIAQQDPQQEKLRSLKSPETSSTHHYAKSNPPPNVVAYGGGGAPTFPYKSFAMGTGISRGGLSFNGTAGGDFAGSFSLYVEAVQRRISNNWLQSTVDPAVPAAPRLTVAFDILRNGTIANIRTEQLSNVYSVDASVLRAIQASSPLDALPSEYSGSKVSVEFWFDYHRP
jgi:hypothetical protein